MPEERRRVADRRKPRGDPRLRRYYEEVGAHIVLKPDLTVHEVGQEYTRLTYITEEVLGRPYFEVLPETASDKTRRALHQSLERVIDTHEVDKMDPQHIPVPRPKELGGGCENRFWRQTNIPVLDDDDNLIYIVHRLEDMTELCEVQQAVRRQKRQNYVLYLLLMSVLAFGFFLFTGISHDNHHLAHQACMQVEDVKARIRFVLIHFHAATAAQQFPPKPC